jgi:hypothetical protein
VHLLLRIINFNFDIEINANEEEEMDEIENEDKELLVKQERDDSQIQIDHIQTNKSNGSISLKSLNECIQQVTKILEN